MKDLRISLPGWQVFSYQYSNCWHFFLGSLDMSNGFSIVVRCFLLMPIRLFLEQEAKCSSVISIVFLYFLGSLVKVWLSLSGLPISIVSRYGIPSLIYSSQRSPFLRLWDWRWRRSALRLWGLDYFSKALIVTYSGVFLTIVCFSSEYILPVNPIVFSFYNSLDLLGIELFNFFANSTLSYSYFFFQSDFWGFEIYYVIYEIEHLDMGFRSNEIIGFYVFLYLRVRFNGNTYGNYGSYSDSLFQIMDWHSGGNNSNVINSICWSMVTHQRHNEYRDEWLECIWIDWKVLFEDSLKEGDDEDSEYIEELYWDYWEYSYTVWPFFMDISFISKFCYDLDLENAWVQILFPCVSLWYYVVVLGKIWLFFCKSFLSIVFSGCCKFYLSFMYLVGVSYYIFQGGVLSVLNGLNRDLVSCHIFPLVVVDTMLKLHLFYSSFEVVYLLSNIGYFMCLWNGKLVYIYHFIEYSRGPFWIFFSIFFYLFSFFYTSKVFLFRGVDVFTRVYCFQFFIISNWFVVQGVGFLGICSSLNPSFLVNILFGWKFVNILNNSFVLYEFAFDILNQYWFKCSMWSYSLLDFINLYWEVSCGLGFGDSLFFRFFLSQGSVVEDNGHVLDEVYDLLSMMESIKISGFILFTIGFFFNVWGFYCEVVYGLYLLLLPWFNLVKISDLGFIWNENYLDYMDVYYPLENILVYSDDLTSPWINP